MCHYIKNINTLGEFMSEKYKSNSYDKQRIVKDEILLCMRKYGEYILSLHNENDHDDNNKYVKIYMRNNDKVYCNVKGLVNFNNNSIDTILSFVIDRVNSHWSSSICFYFDIKKLNKESFEFKYFDSRLTNKTLPINLKYPFYDIVFNISNSATLYHPTFKNLKNDDVTTFKIMIKKEEDFDKIFKSLQTKFKVSKEIIKPHVIVDFVKSDYILHFLIDEWYYSEYGDFIPSE